MNHKYIVTLTAEEQKMLQELVTKGRTQGYRIKYAQILLKLDEIPENLEWTYAKIKDAYHATPHTICQIAKRFVTGGVEAALGRKEQANRHKKVDGRVEAHIIAIACSKAPEGRERWTLQLIKKRRIPAKPGSLEREDYEYRRCGIVDLFVAFEPLACKRVVKLTRIRTAVDFAHFLRELMDIHYSQADHTALGDPLYSHSRLLAEYGRD